MSNAKRCDPICKPSVCDCISRATITIEVKDEANTFFTLNGHGIAYEIAQELTELAKNSDIESLLGINKIHAQSN